MSDPHNSHIPNGWNNVPVRGLIERYFTGPSPTCEERNIQDSEWGILKTTAVTWRGWDYRSHKVAPIEHWGNSSIEVIPGDVLVTKAGPRHRVGVSVFVDSTPGRLMVSGKMIGLRPDPTVILPQVLSGAIGSESSQDYLNRRTTGMAESQVNFSNSTLLDLTIPFPPMSDQLRMVEILGELNESVDGLIEGIEKQSLIRSGVIDDLFSRRCSWSRGGLGDYLSAVPKNGFSPSEVDEWTGVRVLGLGCLTSDGFSPRQLKNVPSSYANVSSALLEDGDFLITRANTRDLVGLVGRYRGVGGACLYPDLMMRLRLKNNVLPDFIESSLRHPYIRRQIMSQAVGTSESMVKISSAIVRRLRINVPPLEEQHRIVSIIQAHDERIAVEKARLEKLRKLKAGLMDDLLTGRVRVNQLDELPV